MYVIHLFFLSLALVAAEGFSTFFSGYFVSSGSWPGYASRPLPYKTALKSSQYFTSTMTNMVSYVAKTAANPAYISWFG